MPEMKKYRRPDGSTYEQYGGPKSAQDVVVEEPAPEPSPTPDTEDVTMGARTTGRGTGVRQRRKKRRTTEAQEGVERAETVEKVAPWLTRERTKSEGGLGGAAARARTERASAGQAGDAIAKKKKDE